MVDVSTIKGIHYGIKSAKTGYDKLNAKNIVPRINVAADNTADSFEDLSSGHFYAAMESKEFGDYLDGIHSESEEYLVQKFADRLQHEIADPSIETDFEAASQKFFENLNREIAENDPELREQLKFFKISDIQTGVDDIREAVTAKPSFNGATENRESLDSIFRHFTSQVDNEVLEPIRRLDVLEMSNPEKPFESTIKHRVREETGVEYKQFQEAIESDQFDIVDLDTISIDLRISIADNFEKLKYTIPNKTGKNELILNDPDLLWDCSCRFSGRDSCKIHSHPLGDEVSQRFKGYVKITYRDIDVIWKDSQYFWPPSVDTIYMVENITEEGIHNEFVKSMCEIGCGTGLMGMTLASLNQSVDQLYMSDWLITPILFSRISWELNKESISGVTFFPIVGYGDHWLNYPSPKELGIDQAFSNPPYLPGLKRFDNIRSQSTVGGTDLLELLIKNGDEFVDDLLVNFSNIALPEAKEAAEKSPASLIQVGPSHEVPFRVPSALSSRKYMAYLLNDRDLRKREDSRYLFWHEVGTYRRNFD